MNHRCFCENGKKKKRIYFVLIISNGFYCLEYISVTLKPIGLMQERGRKIRIHSLGTQAALLLQQRKMQRAAGAVICQHDR